jgi:hypothetical protein
MGNRKGKTVAAPASRSGKPKNSNDAKNRSNVKSHMRDAATVSTHRGEAEVVERASAAFLHRRNPKPSAP